MVFFSECHVIFHRLKIKKGAVLIAGVQVLVYRANSNYIAAPYRRHCSYPLLKITSFELGQTYNNQYRVPALPGVRIANVLKLKLLARRK